MAWLRGGGWNLLALIGLSNQNYWIILLEFLDFFKPFIAHQPYLLLAMPPWFIFATPSIIKTKSLNQSPKRFSTLSNFKQDIMTCHSQILFTKRCLKMTLCARVDILAKRTIYIPSLPFSSALFLPQMIWILALPVSILADSYSTSFWRIKIFYPKI